MSDLFKLFGLLFGLIYACLGIVFVCVSIQAKITEQQPIKYQRGPLVCFNAQGEATTANNFKECKRVYLPV